jgi:uncharacterized protein (TIGR02646 family)
MHFLKRHAATAPGCLDEYRHGLNRWDDLSPEHKAQIRDALNVLQGARCAYCEDGAPLQDGHIDHVRQRRRYPQGTFQWDNLLLSCTRNDSCGVHKDRQDYHWDQLIDPSKEDPERFLRFRSDGEAAGRAGLSATDAERAQTTIRVLNLNSSRLRQRRANAVRPYAALAKEMEELASTPELLALLPQYFQSEFAYMTSLPFGTAIRHYLTPAVISWNESR